MRVTDPQAIRALAHPVRLDLLEVLAAQGPSTAAQCGRALGLPQANCSFHLRQLAKYGYVEEAGPGPDRRERQWQLTDARAPIRIDSTGHPALRHEIEGLVLGRQIDAIRAYSERATDEEEPWQGGLGLATALLAVTAEEAAELRAQWRALLEPYLGRRPDDHPGTRNVRYLMAATPVEKATMPVKKATMPVEKAVAPVQKATTPIEGADR